jgi:adenylate kinase family enzyme
MTRKIAIAGVPRSGKTTRGKSIALGVGELRSTDALKEVGDWSKESEIAAAMFNEPASFVIEGMVVPRALRKWLASNPEGRPVDEVIWMGSPRIETSKGQDAMGKGAETVMREILPELKRRGVTIEGLEP